MAEFLLELFSEEIPARLQAPAAESLRARLVEALGGVVLSTSVAFSTPRRIGCVIRDLPEATPDRTIETRGPRVGAPEAAIAGFLRATGLTSIEECEIRRTDKGSFYLAVRTEPGRPIAVELAEIVPACLGRVAWPKSMRWAGYDVRWVRPLHSILAVLSGGGDSRVVPISWPLDGAGACIEAGHVTYGHRMLAPGAITVQDFADYRRKLEAAYVRLDLHEEGGRRRMATVEAGIAEAAAGKGLTIRPDPALLEEVAGLVEWPVPKLGRIESRFMALPPELLTTSMRAHQKYFACQDASGVLAPWFVVVGNNQPRDGGQRMVAGNERVLRARLSDAAFFWELDRAKTLEARLPKLAERIFHARLGSVLDKVERMASLAGMLAAAVPGAGAEDAARAIRLAKADLSSALVGEFPELQGVMGRYLALNEGLPAEIAAAIEQHYAPLGPASPVPTAPLGIVAALADKIDTLVGFFAIDEAPTGSKDPYALRRAALGVIRIVLENGLRLKLRPVLAAAAAGYFKLEVSPASVEALLSFMAERLKVALRESGVRHDLVTAVLALDSEDDLYRLVARTRALQAFLNGEDGRNLLTAYRRAAGIVAIEEKKDGVRFDGAPDPAALEMAQERILARTLAEIGPRLEGLLQAEEYAEAMAVLARLREPVDAFFERVTVNVDAPELRGNRLRILAEIRASMDRLADFSRIEG